MSILIKGMEMPESCFVCPFREKVSPDDIVCMALNKEFEETFTLIAEKRHKDCPLIEIKTPHGRLIDADELEQEMINGIRAGNYEDGYDNYPHINNMDDCVECVRYADTIIEAETEELRKEKHYD